MKYNFENSRYASFWDSQDATFIMTFLDSTNLLNTNYNFAYENFKKALTMTPTDAKGNASFTVASRVLEAAPMMDMRAPLGEGEQKEQKGVSFYSANIPHFIAPSFTEKATERFEKEELYSQLGKDKDFIVGWINEVQQMKDSADSTLSNMSAQLLSKGNIVYNSGRGIKSPLHKANIPAENFLDAGEKVWADSTCDILTQMAQIEEDIKESTGYNGNMIWQIPRATFVNVILKNQQVKEWLKSYRYVNDKPYIDTMGITEMMFNEAISSYEGLSPINIVVESQTDLTRGGSSTVHGWQDGKVVYRPAGYAGDFQYTQALDQKMFEKYGNNIIKKQFAPLNGGLYTLINTSMPDGAYKEWHTDLIMSAVPSLLEFPQHYIVDITTANI